MGGGWWVDLELSSRALKKPYRGLAARHGVPKCFIMLQVDESWLCPSYSAAVSPGRVVPPLPLAYGGAVAAGAAESVFVPCRLMNPGCALHTLRLSPPAGWCLHCPLLRLLLLLVLLSSPYFYPAVLK